MGLFEQINHFLSLSVTLSGAVSYTMIYNLINFPAGTVPVSTVTAEDEQELKRYKGHFGDPWDKQFVKVWFYLSKHPCFTSFILQLSSPFTSGDYCHWPG